MMEPDSKRLIVLPSVKVSVKAGMRPLGFMARNQGSFWVFLEISIFSTLYGMLRAVSFGHEVLCKYIIGSQAMHVDYEAHYVEIKSSA